MESVVSQGAIDWRELIDLSSEIARRGYGESVIEVALHRKGVPREVARLVAVSAIGCRRAIEAAQSQVAAAPGVDPRTRQVQEVDLRAARAANKALSRLANFLVLLVAGFGVGMLAGWSMGFGRGVEDGFDWIMRAVERLIAG